MPTNLNSTTSFSAIFEGFKLLTHKSIRWYALAPVLINMVIFAIAIALGVQLNDYLQGQYASFIAWLDLHASWLASLLAWFSWLVTVVVFLSISVLFLYFFSSLTQLIAAPFSALLSEQVERHLNLPEASKENPLTFFKACKNAIPRELYKFYKSLKWLLLMLVLMFVPGLNILVPVIGAWLLAIDYLDYPADNRGMSFKQSLQKIHQQRLRHLIFGASVSLALLIPGVNLFAVPAGVCAGTMLWHKP